MEDNGFSPFIDWERRQHARQFNIHHWHGVDHCRSWWSQGLWNGLHAYFLGHLPLLLYGGMVVDRMPRRTVALISDLSQAVLVALAMFALMAGFDVINTLLVITFLTGGAGAFSIPAIGALVPDLVEEEILPQANALRGVAMTLAWMLGPLIGGFTVERWGIEVCLFLDVLTFLLVEPFCGLYQKCLFRGKTMLRV